MNKDKVTRLFEGWCSLTGAEKREFEKLIKEQKAFKNNLNAMIGILKEHGPDAAMAVAQGDLEGAKAAAIKYHKSKLLPATS